jgi:predicted membrane channel-forming protein YqfA (hemolysin III family)
VSSRASVVVIALGIALLVAGLVTNIAALAVLGLFGAVLVGAVWALAAAGDFVRDVSARRFTRDGRS